MRSYPEGPDRKRSACTGCEAEEVSYDTGEIWAEYAALNPASTPCKATAVAAGGPAIT